MNDRPWYFFGTSLIWLNLFGFFLCLSTESYLTAIACLVGGSFVAYEIWQAFTVFNWVGRQTVYLYDDEATAKKAEVMSKWEIICDDGRNPDLITDYLEDKTEFGHKYLITISDLGRI